MKTNNLLIFFLVFLVLSCDNNIVQTEEVSLKNNDDSAWCNIDIDGQVDLFVEYDESSQIVSTCFNVETFDCHLEIEFGHQWLGIQPNVGFTGNGGECSYGGKSKGWIIYEAFDIINSSLGSCWSLVEGIDRTNGCIRWIVPERVQDCGELELNLSLLTGLFVDSNGDDELQIPIGGNSGDSSTSTGACANSLCIWYNGEIVGNFCNSFLGSSGESFVIPL